MLAGYAFVWETGMTGADILTAGSVSVQTDQLAYLVPDEFILYLDEPMSNPGIFDTGETGIANDANWDVATESDNWPEGAIPVRRYVTLGEQTIVYLFMEFSDTDKRDAYFRSYFSANAELVNDYIGQYLNLFRYSGGYTHGIAYTGNWETGADASPGLSGIGDVSTLTSVHDYNYWADKGYVHNPDGGVVLMSSDLDDGTLVDGLSVTSADIRLLGSSVEVNRADVDAPLNPDGSVRTQGAWDLNSLVTIKNWTKNESVPEPD
jgi:hypothetical protein